MKISTMHSLFGKSNNFQLKEAEARSNISFQNRKYNLIETDNEYFLALVKLIHRGNAKVIEEVFFPVRRNEQTELIYSLVVDLLNGQRDEISVSCGANSQKIQVVYKGKTFNLYETIKKVKWDLIKFDKKSLDHFFTLKGFDRFEVPLEKKAHLYTALHPLEKMMIRAYTSTNSINQFLKGELNIDEEMVLKLLIKVAVISSGVNKIAPSDAISKSKYLYGVIPSRKRLKPTIKSYQDSLHSKRKLKELGFVDMVYNKPQRELLKKDQEESFQSIYVNGSSIAKDISGLSRFPEKCECIVLPNTKELFLREISSPLRDGSGIRKHLFIAKFVSKRLKLI